MKRRACAVVALGALLLAAGALARHVRRPAAAAPRVGVLAPSDPFRSARMRRFLAGRSGDITAAVYDDASGRTFLYRPGVAEQTASIAKVEVLAALLARAQAGGGLSVGEQQLATAMIEASDNNDAQALFDDVGQLPALAALDRRLGMTQTALSWSWGLTYTTPRDQLLLLRYVVFRNRVLRTRSRRYILALMEHVESAQAWGISAGPPPGVTVALKNGWNPTGGIWQVNSIGMVKGHHRFYLLAVMTREPDYAYGVATIEGISRIIWRKLRVRHRHVQPVGTTGPSGVTGATGLTGA